MSKNLLTFISKASKRLIIYSKKSDNLFETIAVWKKIMILWNISNLI